LQSSGAQTLFDHPVSSVARKRVST